MPTLILPAGRPEVNQSMPLNCGFLVYQTGEKRTLLGVMGPRKEGMQEPRSRAGQHSVNGDHWAPPPSSHCLPTPGTLQPTLGVTRPTSLDTLRSVLPPVPSTSPWPALRLTIQVDLCERVSPPKPPGGGGGRHLPRGLDPLTCVAHQLCDLTQASASHPKQCPSL